jgi:hypothetical protein
LKKSNLQTSSPIPSIQPEAVIVANEISQAETSRLNSSSASNQSSMIQIPNQSGVLTAPVHVSMIDCARQVVFKFQIFA